MSQSSPAHAAGGDSPAPGGTSPAPAPRHWRVAGRLALLIAIPVVLGLALAGLRIGDAARSAAAYGQAGRLAALGRQVTGLAQALENERTGTAAFIAQGRPAAGRPTLHQEYAVTDRWAATVRQLVPQLGHGYPAQTRADAAAVLASMAKLPGLRRQATQTQASALSVINGYSAATASLFAVNDGIADLSGNAALSTSVRALGALSRMQDQASLQQAILGVALTQGHFEPGALTALTSAQARQATALDSFRSSATSEESWALNTTLATPQARQAQALEQHAIAAGNGPLAFGPRASQQWRAGMSGTVGWMRQAEQQLTDWITGSTKGLQRSALRSALITGGAALAALILVLLSTVLLARSMTRRLRRLEAAHRESERLAAEEAWQRASVSALSARFFRRSYALQERMLWLLDRLELSEEDPERLASLFQMDHLVTRMRRDSDSALVLAGDERRHHPAGPVPLVDVLRAAVSEIEQYDRINLNAQQGFSVGGRAAVDTVHLLAELLENATTSSARTMQVDVCAQKVRDGGVLITITDGGRAMSQERLRQLNSELAQPPADGAFPQHVGLSAVAQLAARHDIGVMLKQAPDGRTAAEVHVPATLISPDGVPGGWLRQAGGVPLDVPFSALRFSSGPMPPQEPETVAPETPARETSAPETRVRETSAPETRVRETVPLGAPVPPTAAPSGPAQPPVARVKDDYSGDHRRLQERTGP
jgi:Nitrate and nitrite sensing/Histidine kinase-, DNA gyrase B-, and HSP90-like ATPase